LAADETDSQVPIDTVPETAPEVPIDTVPETAPEASTEGDAA